MVTAGGLADTPRGADTYVATRSGPPASSWHTSLVETAAELVRSSWPTDFARLDEQLVNTRVDPPAGSSPLSEATRPRSSMASPMPWRGGEHRR